MSKIDELQAQVERLTATMLAYGIRAPLPTVQAVEDRGDYIAFGSPQHAAFLGLTEVADEKDAAGYVTWHSPATGRVYRLLDEPGALHLYPQQQPAQAALIVLRQKVAAFESGAPQVPATAPPLWQPAPIP